MLIDGIIMKYFFFVVLYIILVILKEFDNVIEKCGNLEIKSVCGKLSFVYG